MMRYIKQWQVDLFAVPITLNHEGREKAKSFHGAFITLLFAGFIVWFIYSLSKQMFSHQNPNTITFDTFQEIPDPIELNKDTFPFAIGMQLPSSMNLAYFRDEQIYIPVVKLLVFTVTDNSDGTTTKNRQIINVETEPCTLAHFGSASQNVKKLPLSSLYCIKPEQTNLKKIDLVGKQDFSTYKAFYIAIQKCANTTTTTCKSPEEITQKLTLSWINIIYMQSAINPQNFTDPNQRFAATYTTMLSPTMLKSGIIKLNHLNVIDDDGWLFENKKTKNFIKVDNPVENFNLQPDPRGYLYSGVLELGQVVTTYERRYTKLQTVLAQIQGSAATVVLALIIILRPYSEVKFQETLINELFDVKVKKKDDPKGKNKKNTNKALKKKNSKLQVQELEIPQQPGLVKRFSNQVAVAVNKGIETIQKSPGKEGGGYFHLGSDRPLKSPKEERPEEQEQEKGLGTKAQSFKMLLNSIQNDSPINFSKSPQTVEQRALLDLTKLQDSSVDTTRKYDKGLSLAIEKPGQIKLEALSERISDGPDSPRNVSDISIKEEDKKQTTPEIECLPSPPLSPQNGADIQGLISLEVTDLKQEDETQDEENLNYESARIDISIWEFFSSFVRKSAKTKEKFDVLNKGMKNVRERMDILNIMKKFRELDKLKALLLEEDQLILFNAMPKAEIRPGEAEVTTNDLLMSPRSFSQRILKRSAFIEMNENQESLKRAHDKIQMKAKKSKIDARLLELYNNMLQLKKNNSRANIS